MRRSTRILVVLTVAASLFSTFAASAHNKNGASCSENPGNTKAHKHTAAGSCKDTDDWKVNCATSGNIGPTLNGARVFVTTTPNGAEVEGCSASGDAITHGRAVVVVDTNNGVRAAEDSSSTNPYGGNGYINAQVSTSNPTKSGVYCNADPGNSGDSDDGYGRSWSNPGVESGADCYPTFLPIP